MPDRTCSVEGCNRPLKAVAKALCAAHEQFLRKHGNLHVSTSTGTCANCGETKPVGLMRRPGSSRGGVPDTCQACREANSGWWCIGHKMFHDLSRFNAKELRDAAGRCREWFSEHMAGERPAIACPSCLVEQHFIEFTGGPGSRGLHPCRTCRANPPDSRWWCGYCSQWLPYDRFDKAPRRASGLVTRCKLCRMLAGHHTTLDELLSLNGTRDFRCGICGTQDGRLCVDHDHSCCPGVYSCGRCVAGILCSRCNMTEGNVLTEDRAKAILLYIQRKAARMV